MVNRESDRNRWWIDGGPEPPKVGKVPAAWSADQTAWDWTQAGWAAVVLLPPFFVLLLLSFPSTLSCASSLSP